MGSQSFQVQPVPKPPPDADIDTRMEYLHYQLDCIGTDQEVLRGLKLLGAGRLERLQGGVLLLECMQLCSPAHRFVSAAFIWFHVYALDQ